MDQPDERTAVLVAFGLAVRRLREARGFSQERLAEEVGIHRTYIGDVERGTRNLSLVNIVRVARGLGVQPSALLADVEARVRRGSRPRAG